MKNKPINRNPNIQELSKDHHFGLLFCWKIKEGLKKDIDLERLKTYLNFFWNGHLKIHFQEEEILLFNEDNDSLCDKAKNDHQNITHTIDQINAAQIQQAPLYVNLTTILTDHIRFEERLLFPHLEVLLPPERLQEIGKMLANARKADTFKDNYTDQFWIS
ncbi:MAG TPA: hemerythrin domain-containing protein [Sphingobacteriaceae bacterium]|nr:hemerythrin domain-containing protein [Sphingobacteriaceae bacterium]